MTLRPEDIPTSGTSVQFENGKWLVGWVYENEKDGLEIMRLVGELFRSMATRVPADVDADSRSVARVLHGDEESFNEGNVNDPAAGR